MSRATLARWERSPSTFAHDLFGVRLWSRQLELVNAVVDHPRVSCRSGHKCGKSMSCAILALWWASTQPGARVILLAPTYRQISEIVWREIVGLYRRARWPLGGKLAIEPENGLRWRDGRQIFGFSTDGKERVAGFSGNILYILDEASGIDEETHEVVGTSPRGRVIQISNPTKSAGAFYRSHHQGRSVWHTIAISSEEAARENKRIQYSDGTTGRLYEGIADDDWVEARAAEFGRDSYFYDVRVRGVFSRATDNAVIPLGLVEAAQRRWSLNPGAGPLEVGVDVARFGSDSSVIVWRRGPWASPSIVLNGADNVTVAGRVLEVVRAERKHRERAVVRVDTSNGGGVADVLRRSPEAEEGLLEVIDVLSQDGSGTAEYSKRRDEMWFRLQAWLLTGALPPDEVLAQDLVTPTYDFDERGRRKVESKRDLKKRLGRSPDRADALALATFGNSEAIDIDRVLDTPMPQAGW